jgi:hypothetical protein
MPIEPEELALLAARYARDMTSIRGRRIVRLIRREFAGADEVTIIPHAPGLPAVLGVSQIGAALCASNGKGPAASVIRWLHGATEGVETRYDLLKDSLPALSSEAVELRGRVPAGLACIN